MSNGARGSLPPSPPRARGVLPHSRESCASSNRTSRFKSETASFKYRGGKGRGEASPRGPAPATEREPRHAVEANKKN